MTAISNSYLNQTLFVPGVNFLTPDPSLMADDLSGMQAAAEQCYRHLLFSRRLAYFSPDLKSVKWITKITMRLRITDSNFTTKKDWLFKLVDENQDEYYIMQEAFYKKHLLECPVTKRELDYYDKDQWINGATRELDKINVVVQIS